MVNWRPLETELCGTQTGRSRYIYIYIYIYVYMFKAAKLLEAPWGSCSHATDEGYVPPGFQDLQGSNLAGQILCSEYMVDFMVETNFVWNSTTLNDTLLMYMYVSQIERNLLGTHDNSYNSAFGALDGFRIFQHVVSFQPKHGGHFHICVPGKILIHKLHPQIFPSCTSRWIFSSTVSINQH